MMVTILVAVLALQFLLLERDRRETMERLTEIGSGLDRSTALLVAEAHDMAQRPMSGGLETLLERVAGSEGLANEEAELTIVVWSDSSHQRHHFTDPDSFPKYLLDFHPARLSGRFDSLGSRADRRGFFSDEAVDLFVQGEGDSMVVRGEFETIEDLTWHQVVVRGEAAAESTTWEVTEDFVTTEGRTGPGPVRGTRTLRTQGRFRAASSDTSLDMIINLPLPTASADSFLSLQVRYPLDTIQAELEAQRKRGLLWLGTVLGVGVLGAILVAGQFTRPIRTLQSSFRSVEGGDLSVHVDPERRDEIGQLTESFNEMVDRLRESREVESRLGEAERLASVGRLAAGVAHEVRNPLNAIQLTIEQMRETALTAIDEKAPKAKIERYHQLVSKEVARLESLVGAFLDLARQEELELTEMDAATSLRTSVELFRSQAEEHDVRLEFFASVEGSESKVPVLADPARLPAVWNNLLSNALGVTPAGGSIEVRAIREGTDWVVTIQDSGPGIAPEDRGRIWDPFFSRRNDGTGLGLSIVRAVAERHGGTVRVLPSERGAHFEVRLPMIGAASDSQTGQKGETT